MSKAGQLLERYWVIYYLIYAGFSAYYLRQHWNSLPAGSLTGRAGAFISDAGALANAFGASAGIAVLTLILLEGAGHMFLLIPATIKKIRNEERQEGREEGREEQREANRKATRQRTKQAFELFGVEVDGVLVLPATPEVMAFLNGGGGESA